jgi:hypothetical protein
VTRRRRSLSGSKTFDDGISFSMPTARSRAFESARFFEALDQGRPERARCQVEADPHSLGAALLLAFGAEAIAADAAIHSPYKGKKRPEI